MRFAGLLMSFALIVSFDFYFCFCDYGGLICWRFDFVWIVCLVDLGLLIWLFGLLFIGCWVFGFWFDYFVVVVCYVCLLCD